MKKLRITWLCLILAGILLGVSSCSNDAEELQGKLVITFAKPTKGLKVAICPMENTKYPILVESPNVNGVLKVSLNIGNYYCLLYTSPSPRDGLLSRMPSSA